MLQYVMHFRLVPTRWSKDRDGRLHHCPRASEKLLKARRASFYVNPMTLSRVSALMAGLLGVHRTGRSGIAAELFSRGLTASSWENVHAHRMAVIGTV